MTTPPRLTGRAVLLALLMLALFASPSVSWWLDADPPWYLPYALWLAVIVLAAWQAWAAGRAGRRDDD